MSRILIFSWANFIMRGDWGGENETTSSGKCQRSQVNQLPASKLLLKWLKMSTRINKKKRERMVLIHTSQLSLAQYSTFLSSLLQYSLFLSLPPSPFPSFACSQLCHFNLFSQNCAFVLCSLKFPISILSSTMSLFRCLVSSSINVSIFFMYLYYQMIINFILRIDCSCWTELNGDECAMSFLVLYSISSNCLV